MAQFDFDASPDRRGSDSMKWRRYASAGEDVIGAWVADMDFLPPEPVRQAVHERLEHSAAGYVELSPELVAVMIERLERLYGWRVAPEWILDLSGVVPGLFGCVRCFDGAVITQSPNYYHFFGAADYSERPLLRVDNHLVNGRWEMDFDQLSQHAAAGASCFLLCNPHNPVGRVLERSELETVAEHCLRNDMVVCSDEIHADLVLDEDKAHLPIASLSPEIEQKSITLISPSKAFNLVGIGTFAAAIIPDPALRERFRRQLFGVSSHPSVLAQVAALAAYRDGAEWLDALRDYLRGNRDRVEQAVAGLSGLEMTHVEATYLAWLDVSELGLSDPFQHFLDHGVALSDGAPMGDAGFLRLNYGCTRDTLETLLARIRGAL